MKTIASAPKASDLSAISTTFTLFKKASDSSAACVLYLPGHDRLNGKRFRVRASGTATTAGSYTVLATLQFGTSATTSSNTTIEASTARSIATATTSWWIEADLTVNDTGQVLIGNGRSMVGNTLDTWAALDNAPTAVDTTTEGQGFVAGITFGTNNASNTATLKEFVLEAF